MRVLGWEIMKRSTLEKALSSVPRSTGWGNEGWTNVIREPYSGAWQRNDEKWKDGELIYFAIFACITLIASDISKLGIGLVRRVDREGRRTILEPTSDPRYTPFLTKPNHFQNEIQFWESWLLSKLSQGNTYALKQRSPEGNVIRQYVLDPWRVRPMVAENGDVFYQLSADDLADIEDTIMVPASEIIHDRFNTLYHPLVGLSPIIAAALSASQGKDIQEDSRWFFKNRGIPGGILTAPGAIADSTAERLKQYWDDNFTGRNAGKVAVVGDGLKFESMRFNATDSQVIEQLRWTAEVVCSVFHVPPYKIGIGPMPTYNNVQALNLEYYSQALQSPIKAAELAQKEGLELPDDLEARFDIRELLRMDSLTQIERIEKAIGAGVMAPNEGREEINLPPVPGGDTPYMQQQNYSLAALDERDRNSPLLAPESPEPSPTDDSEEEEDVNNDALTDAERSLLLALIEKDLSHVVD